MLFRRFLNADPPKIAQVWAQQPPSRGVARCVDAQMLEDHVFSRPYFDPEGLIVAEDEGRVVGFAHAGFGPNQDESNIDYSVGVISLLLVVPDVRFADVAPNLIDESEAYLRRRGALVIYAGSVKPLNPFYLGFYGGSELPGLLESQSELIDLLRWRGYVEADRTVIMECDLTHSRPLLDRRQVQNKRRFEVQLQTTVPSRSWWDACTAPPTEVQRFILAPTSRGEPVGHVVFWLVEPLSTSRGVTTAGLSELVIEERSRRQGLAFLLNAEAMRQLRMQRFEAVEAHTMLRNAPAVQLYERLGFRRVSEGVILRKS